ncbi:glycosyl transferase family 2 [Curtobacterium sp. PhB130]|uniref:glycosyltransferase family 2 protein n=1 Tax=Curtobacterium sp. PhB130 TaxID=2485178 RepID=UPI000F4C9761|nr:glycosyltransferase family A protein [Curtobacterium sp. PhB130]ROS75880.1 glycosyl transferase family 2 [Curtobacterium sp. PhB130]
MSALTASNDAPRRTGAVITSFNQGAVLGQAVESALRQSSAFDRIVVVDDGSTEADALASVRRDSRIQILRLDNRGVSAARNAGIAALDTELIAVLDGDDYWHTDWASAVVPRFDEDEVLGASTQVQTFGVGDWVVRPEGGDVVSFLAKNNCPSSLMFRRDAWQRAHGYDESLTSGFEDWDFALRLLSNGGRIDIVPEALLQYRTVPASANIVSMDNRLDLYAGILDRHSSLFQAHHKSALLQLEATSTARLNRIRDLMVSHPEHEIEPISTFGDGGVAAAVSAATARARHSGELSAGRDRPTDTTCPEE